MMKKKTERKKAYRVWTAFRKNQRGAAIVAVIVVIAIVSVLASMPLYMAYSNHVMKISETKAKDNFYSAETVLNQIHVGLQMEVSDAVSEAYFLVSQMTASETESQRQSIFQNKYISQIKASIQKKDISNQYEIGSIDSLDEASGFYAFLDSDLRKMALNYDGTTKGAKSDGIGFLHLTSQAPALLSDENGMTIKKLMVQFCDADGYYSEICTDIIILFPSISMATQKSFPEVYTYAIIANQGVSVEKSMTIVGNLYAGNHLQNTDQDSNVNGIVVKGSSTLTLGALDKNYATTVIKGGLKLSTSGKIEIVNENLWTDSITLNSGCRLTSKGEATEIFNADDLTIYGSGNEVALEGSYVGYGNGIDYKSGITTADAIADLSSAIITNCKNSTINLSGLKRLYLAGTAYLTPKSNTGLSYSDSQNAFPIMIGNSVAVKTDQLAYLIPKNCIGVLNGESMIDHNPLSQDVYDLWQSYNQSYAKRSNIQGQYEVIDFDKLQEEYQITDKLDQSHMGYQVVAKQSSSGSMYYVYLAFDDETTAAKFYQAYEKVSKEKLKTYAKKYNNIIKLPSVAASTGNMVSFHDEQFTISNANIVPGEYEELEDITGTESMKYTKDYENLCCKMTTNESAISESEKGKSLYENLICNIKSVNAIYGAEGEPKALIKSGNYTINSSTPEDVHLIIASGNVTVKKNFEGCIIAGGVVKLQGGSKITLNDQKVQKALLAEVDETTHASVATQYFVNGSQYSKSGDTGVSAVSYTNVKDLIVYENWSKH